MTEQQQLGRIAELEHALEDLLEIFDDNGTDIYIDVLVPVSDGLETMPMAVSEEVEDVVDGVSEILFGGAAYAEEG